MNSQEKKKNKFIKFLKQFWLNHETKVVLIIGFILVAVIAFEAGILHGQKWQQKPLIIEKSVQAEATAAESQTPTQTQNSALEGQKQAEMLLNNPQNCAFIGSKNSTKYHLPTCQWAKRIKPENTVCFKNEEEAKSRGYTPCGTCIK